MPRDSFFLSSASSGRQNNSLYFYRRALDLLRLVHLPDQEEAYSYCDGLTQVLHSFTLVLSLKTGNVDKSSPKMPVSNSATGPNKILESSLIRKA